MLQWIDGGFSLCRTAKPATPPVHLVSYFVWVDDDHLLLVHHRDAGLWLATGGHVEPEEHPVETVRREATEEMGIKADLLLPTPLFLTKTTTVGTSAGHTDISLWYVLKGDRQQDLRPDPREFHRVGWFGFNALPTPIGPDLPRFVQKLKGTAGNALLHGRRRSSSRSG